ncbi:MAG: hypothetical protein HPM95_04535 [Alphaproteobacteria bacterium]|nr:hypothetical protein [Alphaproteobacteria bacterium]
MSVLIYQIANFVLAALMYTLLGRLALTLLLGAGHSGFMLRAFARLTDPALWLVRLITPSLVPQGLLLIFAVTWTMIARVLLPLVSPPAARASGRRETMTTRVTETGRIPLPSRRLRFSTACSTLAPAADDGCRGSCWRRDCSCPRPRLSSISPLSSAR